MKSLVSFYIAASSCCFNAGDEMILQNNLFVELLLPRSIIRTLSDDEMSNYLEPFKEPGESRRPTLTWPREIPIVTDGMCLF